MTMTMDEIVQRFEEVERRLDALEHLASAARDDAKPVAGDGQGPRPQTPETNQPPANV